MPGWRPFDHEAVRRQRGGRCFICGLVAGEPEFAHTVIHEDDSTIAFLSKYPTVPAYTLVAPRTHREQATSDFSADEYLALQRVIYRVGEAIRAAVPTERLYILSLGSQQANRHVHWHLVPLPPGVPFEQQQYAALDRQDYLEFSDEEIARLAAKIRKALGRLTQAKSV